MTTASPGVAVSVITAVAGTADPGHVAEAYASLTSQAGDIAWEWVVQLDTATGGPELPKALTGDPRVSVGRNQSAGPALARTTALARARGDVVVVLDVDDRLTEHALVDIVTVLEDVPDVGWTTAPVVDLLPGGSTSAWPHDPPAGRLSAGTVTTQWSATAQLAVHPATLACRRHLLIAAGGWMALPVSEEVALLVALDAMSDGWFHHRPGLLRRTHPGQMTRLPHHESSKESVRGLVLERAAALAALRL